MKRQIFLRTTMIMFAGLLCYFAISAYVTHVNNIELAKDYVIEITELCADLYSDSVDLSSFVNAGKDTRITVIAPDGVVLADSRPLYVDSMENHLARPEVDAARRGVPTAFVRYSDTLGADMIYYTLKVEADGAYSDYGYVFIRAAIPVAKIETYILQSLPVLILLLLVVALICFIFARSVIRSVTSPLEYVEDNLRLLTTGEYVPGSIPGSFDEINKITQSIDEVAGILIDGFNALSGEKAKLNYILNNIGDGLIVVDETKSVMLINTVALEIFDANPSVVKKNMNYLSNEKMILAAVEDCVNSKKSALFEILLNGHIYFVAVKRLPETTLTMIVLSDVTENRENAKRREEFFANASHELKTPLTAIKGFNELAAINNHDDAIDKYIVSIARETDRMLTLIGDMLKLSALENTQETNPVPVSLATIVNEVCETLSAAICEKSINVEITGDADVTSEQGHIYDLIKNLIENAVRYTGKSGSVSIKIDSENNVSRMIISDNGIGISPEEQTRIFERFYRVEKSRALRNGGTGLGLSIVKHICVLYDWKLTLKSKLGVGTEISVDFK